MRLFFGVCLPSSLAQISDLVFFRKTLNTSPGIQSFLLLFLFLQRTARLVSGLTKFDEFVYQTAVLNVKSGQSALPPQGKTKGELINEKMEFDHNDKNSRKYFNRFDDSDCLPS